jgi:organic hydroperoxide reductase OsmC/OhrA
MVKQEARCKYLSTIYFQTTLGTHHDDLGTYKELLDHIEAKA